MSNKGDIKVALKKYFVGKDQMKFKVEIFQLG